MAETKSKMDFINDAEDSFEGFDDINTETMSIPFLKLAQDLTPQTKKNKPEFIEGLDVGMFFNSVTGENYGSHLEIIIVKFERVYIEWLPNRGGFVGYHSPEIASDMAFDKTFGKWKTEEGNELVEYYAYYLLINGKEINEPMIMSLASTAIKVAKNLNRMMTTHIMDNGKRAKPFYLIYNLDSVSVTKGSNDYQSYKFTFKEYITEIQHGLIVSERLALPDKPVDYAMIENKAQGQGASKEQEDDF
jgi:hypothetical protein